MKMESPSAIAIDTNNKSKEDLLLLSENNNTDTANGESNTNDSKSIITGSVAMTTSSKLQPHPEDDSKPEAEAVAVHLNVVNSANSPSTDDSKNRVINHVDIGAEESEVIQEEVVQEEDRQTDSTALREQEGASSDDNVIQAADSNDENKINDEDVDPSSDLIDTEEVLSEDVEGQQVAEECEKTIEKSDQGVESDGKSNEDRNEENTNQEGDVQNEENVMEVEDQTEVVNADVEVKDEHAAKDDNSWSKMHLTEDVSDGNQVQAASPGHTEQRPNTIAALTTAPTIVQRNGIVKATNEENAHKTKIVTNGNDHTEDDDDTTNSIKTEQEKTCPNKSPEYTATTAQAVDLDAIAPPKRRMSASSSQDQPAGAQSSNSKRMKITTLENHDFKTRDQILNNYMENMDCAGFEGLKNNSDQLLSEIQKLGELAKMKEREWNQILHQKKLREELLLRLQRAKQILVLQTNGSTNSKHQDQLLQRYQTQQPNQQQHRQVYQQQQDVSVIDKGRQGPLLDVQKMISDYRQTHPESIPRRGRRIRGQDGQQGLRYDSGNLLTFSNVALGSGSQVRTTNSSSSLANINQDIYNEFSLLLSSMDNDRLKTASSSSIKELLAQFARMSASERQDLLNSVKGPHNITSSQTTSYPEVTVHPVQQSAAPITPSTSNSLLHGILTKPVKSTASSNESKQPTFSPTLARLLTAPERSAATTTTATTSSSTSSTSTSSATASSAAISVSSAAASVVSASSLIHSSISSNHQHHRHKNTTSSAQQNNNHQSLSDLILSSTKARNEITITPVQQYEDHSKSMLHHQDDEADDGTDRLVIDEGDGHSGRNKQAEEEAAEEVPQCQGCNHKAAQFVCAGCGNQWYCSRECQVSAWDEHSEVCSG